MTCQLADFAKLAVADLAEPQFAVAGLAELAKLAVAELAEPELELV